MKRSEMLKIIAGFVRDEFQPKTEEGWDLSYSYSVSLMDLIEDLGMKPPRDPVLLRDEWEEE